jgi:hypothetical protein
MAATTTQEGAPPMTTTTRHMDIRYVHHAVRRNGIIGAPDLLDMAASVDTGEEEWVGPGEAVWLAIRHVSQQSGMSAQFVVDETILSLGW